MYNLNFEKIYESITSIADSDLMVVLNFKENLALKKKATELMFKSHNLLSKQINDYDDWLLKVTFFQYVSDFLDYLSLLKSKS